MWTHTLAFPIQDLAQRLQGAIAQGEHGAALAAKLHCTTANARNRSAGELLDTDTRTFELCVNLKGAAGIQRGLSLPVVPFRL